MSGIRVGHLTAVVNSNIPMTVQSVVTDGEGNVTHAQCVYFAGNEVKYHTGELESFIGFGDYLTFSGGEFIEAYDADEDDEDEEGDDVGMQHATN